MNQFTTEEIREYRESYLQRIANGDPTSLDVIQATMMLESADAELERREIYSIGLAVVIEDVASRPLPHKPGCFKHEWFCICD